MLLVPIRIAAVIIGTMFFLPAFPVVFFGFRENLWLLPIGLLNGLFGAWLISAGWYGTWSGQAPKDESSSSPRMPNTR
jgi:hypothetical protein